VVTEVGAGPAAGRTRYSPGVVLMRWTGLALVLLLIVSGTTEIVSLFFRQSRYISTALPSSVHEVVLGTTIGDIRIRAAAPGESGHLEQQETWALARPEVSTSVTDGVLTVDARCAPWGPSASFCIVDLDLVVDEETSVVAHSNTGDLSVHGVSGRVQLSSSTGSIMAEDIVAEEVRATTSTGDVTLGLLRAPTNVQARTSTGDVLIDVPGDGTTYRVLASTSVGEQVIRVSTDPAAANLIDVSTSVGDIVIATSPS
jgi:hypothetical protein